MTARTWIICTIACLIGTSTTIGQTQKAREKPTKKVLVELFTSQGCNSCPSANDFLGDLAKLGYGPDQVVPVAFHVDYFNQPWADPFSTKAHSQRELAYNTVLKRDDLYFTPMMMVDGRSPMLGSNRPEAIKAIKKAMVEEAGASLKLTLEDKKGSERPLKIEIAPVSKKIEGRDLMVGVTITEGPIATKVRSGENGGQTLVEPFVVRSFVFQKAKLEADQPLTLDFTLKLAEGSVASKCRVSAFVQDWENGQVYQAESIRWVAEAAARK